MKPPPQVANQKSLSSRKGAVGKIRLPVRKTSESAHNMADISPFFPIFSTFSPGFSFHGIRPLAPLSIFTKFNSRLVNIFNAIIWAKWDNSSLFDIQMRLRDCSE